MKTFNIRFQIIVQLYTILIYSTTAMYVQKKHPFFYESVDSNVDVADLIASKGYLPRDTDLEEMKPALDKSETEVTYVLSKLSDKELVTLLNDQPKKSEYDLDDIVNVALDSKSKKRYQKVTEKSPKESQDAVFRLDNSEVNPFNVNVKADIKDVALQQLNNLLYSHQKERINDNDDDDEAKRELLFDSLVAQLKTLCFKSKKNVKNVKGDESANEDIFISKLKPKPSTGTITEEMFLILNDDVKSNGSDELIYVDPDSLSQNSSVLLLGPVSSPLSDTQLQVVMNRITNELAKPEYQPILKQLASGAIKDDGELKTLNLVMGPQSRRYIKPHRCNYQSKLARVFGGPRWILCTGYINLNTASLYD